MNLRPDFFPHVMTLGTGPRRALALHCTMAFGGAWGGLARLLGERLTLVAPDMPSHGKSADWDEVSEFSETVYQATLSALDSEPMDLIGHSFGAVIALRIAHEYPEKVRSLTVIEPVFFAVAMRRRPEVMKDHDERSEAFYAAIEERDWPTAARTFNRMWSDKSPKWDTLPERTRAAMIRGVHVVPG
ncbi:MAG: alpha/beta fold hydrolase, partial [Sulfitobacter sp.]|nr:alpha/beta fold hydrolase [Sulfitobacter sp.]